MWATRYQFPIGQGCFHAGDIGISDSESNRINYVYDCGSTKQRPLQNAIDFYKTRTSSIDALFVSHFDADHVSGLDRLLASVEVDTVYIPYVDQLILILDLIEAEVNGALSASLIEASIEPESWFGRRGVQRVVRIRGSGYSSLEEPSTTTDDSPGQPTEGSQPLFDEQRSIEDLTVMERPLPRRHRRGVTGERSELLLAEPGFRIIILARHMISNWLLLPHVDPAPRERRSAFKREMRAVLGLQSYQRLTSAILAEAFRTRKKRDYLRECYDKIIAGGAFRHHNRISMSLFSGPTDRGLKQTWKYWIRNYPFFKWPDMECLLREPIFHPLLRQTETEAVGWLGTGDAALNMREVREKWQETYQPIEDQISTLLLPHHGSHRNFHGELLQFPNLKLCIASAGDPSQYRHPSGEVVATIQESGKTFCHVSEHLHSGFIEKMVLV